MLFDSAFLQSSDSTDEKFDLGFPDRFQGNDHTFAARYQKHYRCHCNYVTG